MPWRSRTSQRSNGMSAATGMILVLLGLSVLFPAVLVQLNGPTERAVIQNQSEELVLSGNVVSDVEVRDFNATTDRARVVLINQQTGDFNDSQQYIQEGDSKNMSISGSWVNVTTLEVTDNSSAFMKYTYPTYLGWPENSHVIAQNTPLIIILGSVMLLAGMIMVAMRGVL